MKKMRNITINLPYQYDDKIMELKEKGIIPSRSEAVRTAIREYLPKDLLFMEDL